MSAERERLRELMVGFAAGRIAEDELRELLALLQDQEQGTEHAAAAWEVLDTAAALRASAPELFLDQVVLRLGSDGQAVARAVAARIGRPRPRLEPVPPPPRSHRRMQWILASAALAAAVIAVVLWWMQPGPPARVAAVEGVIVAGEQALIPGAALPDGALVLGSGTRLDLILPDGGAIRLTGPAQAVVAHRQWSLSAGRATVSASGALRIGLPEVAILLAAGDAIEVDVAGPGATVAATAGAPRCRPAAGAERILRPGSSAVWSPAK